MHEMGPFFSPYREITLAKRIVLESKSEMCKLSIVAYFWYVTLYYMRVVKRGYEHGIT